MGSAYRGNRRAGTQTKAPSNAGGLGHGYTSVVAHDLGWTLEAAQREPDHHICPHISGAIVLSDLTFDKITALMEHFDTEWLAYLVGRWVGEDAYVTDLNIPSQEVTSTSVDKVDSREMPEDCIGVIHSHVRMGAFFSGTDDTWINDNHNVSIVVSKKNGVDNLEFKSQVRKRVACGVNMLMEMKIFRESTDQKAWVETVKEKVGRPTYSYQRYQYSGPVGGVQTGAPGATTTGAPTSPQKPTYSAAEMQDMKAAYTTVVNQLSRAEGVEQVTGLLHTIPDDTLEDATLFIEENNGNKDLLALLTHELSLRVQADIQSVGMMVV